MKTCGTSPLMSYATALALALLLLQSCTAPESGQSDGKLRVVTTTGMIADAVTNIGGDRVSVTVLMGPGVDPHLYKASHGDLEKITAADLILYNGLHLEGKMGEVLGKAARTKRVIAVADALTPDQLRGMEGYSDTHDPHIWFDVSLWAKAVRHIAAGMAAADTANAGFFKENAAHYVRTLDSLHAAVRTSIATIPKPQRVLITAHDAFGYFGDAYDIEVRGLQGISTVSEFGLRDVTSLVSFIIERKIKAIFVETSVSGRSIEAVVAGCGSRGWNVTIGGSLYSDAMGSPDSDAGTYVGMVNANVTTIVNALR